MRKAIVFLSAVLPLAAWNHVGHKAVAGLAYDHLSKTARSRVDELIRRHPDYKLLSEGGPTDAKDLARYAFMKAAFWPDIIKGDARFYDEARGDGKPTATLTGFPDMKQRRNWHYINVPFSVDGTPTLPPPTPNVLTQLKVILETLARPAAAPGSVPAEQDAVYLLPWFLHLAGDVHNPMHCVTRFRKGQNDPATGKPWGDLGGNTVYVSGAYNLHALWDDALGMVDSPTYIDGVVKLLKKLGKEDKPVLDPERWVQEGFALAQSVAYSFGNEGGFRKDDPIALDSGYISRAKEVARKRASLAGFRIAALLNNLTK